MSACTSANRVGAPESLRLFTYEKRVISFSNRIPSGHLWIIWINIKSCSSSSFAAALSTVPIIFDRINLAPTSLYHWQWRESFYWKMDHRSGEGVKVLCSADYQYFFLGKPIENFLPSCIMSSRSSTDGKRLISHKRSAETCFPCLSSHKRTWERRGEAQHLKVFSPFTLSPNSTT